MPGEVRNLIYHYALIEGSYRYHKMPSDPSRTNPPWLCSRPYDETMKQPKPRQKYALGLLCACRQINHEAALLPFKLNNFYFNHAYDIIDLGATISRTQRHAITTIQFRFQVRNNSFTDTGHLHPPVKMLSQILPNLQTITIMPFSLVRSGTTRNAVE